MAGMVGGGLGLGFWYGVAPESFIQHLSMIAQNQIAQAGFFFTLAAWLHAGRVKSEIRSAFSSLTESIDSLGATLSQQLQDHATKLSDHEKKLAFMASQLSQFEPQATKKQPIQGD